ncbi:beta-lactamase/transpeptidase-like protein [Aspergillus sclerotioniger CBS 115572]|uniref:Beta-lactamase/transpeptidase-like protein n=1 Tax=Aspergillus sclerotioniger CBS 115572 TaxID=1450535 RepID=A0A317WNB7_9EURO|nr:beta-lactamase/transpeptidase-like protein [Aspergillus sclerotioniger CBS 115572]PWY87986.1 beta-lactamase/transpeptidase-like protein [Aspergillus sclerotioniger CBS 115572]
MTTHIPTNPLDESFKNLVHETLTQWHVPGISIAVVDGDNTWAEGYGTATFPSTPVTPSTLFYAGSTTKAFTAAILATLVTDNTNYPQVQWDMPISDLIREDFVLHDPHATSHTTIEDALSHRSGLPRHDQAYGNHLPRDTAVREIVRQLRHLPLTAPPRTKFQYCNLMYVAATHIIETLTGEWLGDILAREIWHPLDMTATFFDLDDAKQAPEDLARGYYHSVNEDTYHEVDWMPCNEISGAGAVITNVLDYAKWARALLDQTEPLSQAVYKAIWEPRTLAPSGEPFTGPTAYALGWWTGFYQGVQYYEHTGGVNAFGAELILFPALRFAVIALANTAGTSNYAEKALAFHLVDERLGVPVEKRFDWNAKNMSHIEAEKKRVFDAINQVPSEPVLPALLPLEEYVGTYVHPGYQTVKIYFDQSEGVLRADRASATWPEFLKFKHVNGEHFIIVAKHIGDLGALFPEVYEAEFRIGEKGKPTALGVAWEATMKEKIWFPRSD